MNSNGSYYYRTNLMQVNYHSSYAGFFLQSDNPEHKIVKRLKQSITEKQKAAGKLCRGWLFCHIIRADMAVHTYKALVYTQHNFSTP